MIAREQRWIGCLLGLATGDVLGAPHEGGFAERALWRLLGRTRQGLRRFTDDTQMAIDLAESLLARGSLDPDDVAQRFAASWRWSRGYGPGTAAVLRRIRRGQHWSQAARAGRHGGSWGNGAAMRAPVLALFIAGDPGALRAAARASAAVTHAHPLAIEAAALIAAATAAALDGGDESAILEAARSACSEPELLERLGTAEQWLTAAAAPSVREIRDRLGNGIAAARSVPTALFLALQHGERTFDELNAAAIRLGGDVDTILAMAGAVWGSRRGSERLPAVAIEQRERITALAQQLCRASSR